ncbi:hypothetical protein [Roseibium sp.]|uniref:hypothetical protein n=1 Tax=Roseibium sp. TaxID=1936156 RepID=UPI001AFFF698|nr:hypothetical protein [Roseibium sp.]MBO6858478.1 hypothetical protein [Roseibium sp.]
MSTTRLIDTIEPSVFTRYMSEAKPEKYVLLQQSGILAAPPEEVSSQFMAGGMTIDMPFWQDLTRGEAEIPTDDPNEVLDTEKIETSRDKATKHINVHGWSSMSLSGMVATGMQDDPIKEIADKVVNWWNYETEHRIIRTLKGVFYDNIASNGADMLYQAYSDISSPLAANKISNAVVNRARLTMGDQLEQLSTIVVHTDVYGTMLDDEKIDFIQPSASPFRIPTYMGMTVLYSDMMPTNVTSGSGDNSDEYLCFLIGRGAFAYQDVVPSTPTKWGTEGVEVVRDAKSGNGGGQDELVTRRRRLIHPRGIKWNDTNRAKKAAPSYAELEDATNWTRVYERKNIRFAGFTVNV